MKKVITYGTFDLLHEGHLNILKAAKALGDYLIVGITSENYDRARGKLNVYQSLSERIENVRKTGLADLIIVEEFEGQKIEDIQKYNIDIFAIGSDWKGKFDYLNEYTKVVYLPRTKGISSTELRNKSHGILRLGVVGYGRIANRFILESKYVSGLNVEGVFGPSKEKAKNFVEKYELLYWTDDYIDLLKKVDAVYIASPHHTHYEYTKIALEHKKHVLCEKPLWINRKETEKLFNIAEKNHLVLLEALKTAYAPGFLRLISIIKSGKIGKIFEVDSTFTKLVEDNIREMDVSTFGGSMTELVSYTLLPVVKILGLKFNKLSFFPIFDENKKVDIYTKTILDYKNAIASMTVGLKGKKEGDLIVSGSNGYIYVPAPWWKTEYFEIRDKEGNIIERIADKFDGDGLRYEIAEFLRMINNKNIESYKLKKEESLFFSSIIEEFFKRYYNNAKH